LGSGLGDPAGADAGGADAKADMPPVYYGPDPLQVHVPAPPGDVMGVTNFISKARPLAANFTNSCHVDCVSNLSLKV